MNSADPQTNRNNSKNSMATSSKLPSFVSINHEVNDLTAQQHPLPAKDLLTSLPQELHLHIFSYLDQCASCCFGLTCKTFHSIHKHTYKWTSLLTETKLSRGRESVYLYHLLQEFIGDRFSAKRRKNMEGMIDLFKTADKMSQVWGKALSALDDCGVTRRWYLIWTRWLAWHRGRMGMA